MNRRIFIWYFFLFITSCFLLQINTNSVSKQEKLRFAVADTLGIEKLKARYEEFRKVLTEVLGREIEFFPVQEYTEAIAALLLNQVDLVFAGPSEYVIIRARTNAVPLVALTRVNYYSVIAVNANSKIESLAQLKGKTIAMGKVGSTSNHLGPTKILIDAGLDPKSELKIFMLAAEEGLQKLKNGQVDAWGGTIYNYQLLLKNEGLSAKGFPLIAKGEELPNDVFVANSNLEPDLIEQIRDRLLENQEQLIEALLASSYNQVKFQGSKLVPANDTDYEMIREVYQASGEDDYL